MEIVTQIQIVRSINRGENLKQLVARANFEIIVAVRKCFQPKRLKQVAQSLIGPNDSVDSSRKEKYYTNFRDFKFIRLSL